MNRKQLTILAFLGGAILGAAVSSALSRTSQTNAGITNGTAIELQFPTGETVSGINGAYPQPEYRSVNLRVARINADGPSTLGSPFRVRIGDTTYYAIEDGD